jgi:RNA polymerase sigma-70 factor (ECF subfamily)
MIQCLVFNRRRSDEDMCLMSGVQRGDPQAYTRLYEIYVPIVRRYLASHRGRAAPHDDLVQEVFTRLWEHRGKYRLGMAVGPYLLGFAKNVYREHLTRVCRESTTELREPHLAADRADLGPEVLAEHNDQTERVRLHLAKLPPKQRQALELTYLKGLSSREASRLLGCSARTVRVNCRIGLRKLKMLVRSKRHYG